jgi:hypothetical protein
MALKDSEMKVVSLAGTAVLVGALFAPVLVFANAGSDKPSEDNLVAIEASIAYSKTPQKQPQKKFKAPDEVKPEGVSHDPDKKPDEKKPDEKKPDKKPDLTDISKFKHGGDDDDPVGKPTTDPGKFNGNEQGYAEETKGDPWLGKLGGELHQHFTPPEIAKGNSTPVGCIHLTADGKIVDSKWITTTGDEIQGAAEIALQALIKGRNANPEPVPTHLLSITTKWLCFKFTVQSP